jgi:hypothetical protein
MSNNEIPHPQERARKQTSQQFGLRRANARASGEGRQSGGQSKKKPMHLHRLS